MSDVFISYARSTHATAQKVADALRALGYGVWIDDDIPAHRPYTEVLDEHLPAAGYRQISPHIGCRAQAVRGASGG